MSTSAGSSLREGRAGSALLACAVLLASLPLLATAPQSGDGAELMRIAEGGGVPHPPGFPLYAWLARAFAALPLGTVALRLSLLSLLAHAGMVFFVSEALRHLRLTFSARLFGALACALFPTLWRLGLQPEVFATAHLLLAAALYLVVRLALEPPTLRLAALLGLTGALAGSAHTLLATALPLLLVGVLLVLAPRSGRGARLAALFFSSLPVFLALYATLPWLAEGAVWPSWGRFEGARDVVRHALREEYGLFSLKAAGEEGPTLSALSVLLEELWASAHLVPTLLVPAGLLALWRRGPRALFAALALALATGLFFLVIARYPDSIVARGYLERFFGPAVIPGALLAALGLDALLTRLSGAWRGALAFVTTLFLVVVAARELPNADLSRQRSLQLVQQLLAQQVPDEALYLANADIETFHGLEREGRERRYPLSKGVLGLDWYREDKLPLLEPRLKGAVLPPPPGAVTTYSGIDAIVRWAAERAIPVVATDRALLRASPHGTQLAGLLYVTRAEGEGDLGRDTLVRAGEMCLSLRALEPLPSRGQHLALPAFRSLARAYDAASTLWRALGAQERANAAADIARALERPRGPPAWREGCARLVSLVFRPAAR